MYRTRAVEVAVVSALAALVTALVAAPVLMRPSELLFGMDIVGRHYDPFAVMAQMRVPLGHAIFLQPVTDIPAALLSRLLGPVAAHNGIVLATFPLSAASAYLLARYLALSPVAAGVAALAYAFSPFHFAHAAYHLHVAQTQWIPLYLLALLHSLSGASAGRVAWLAAATIAVSLSNYYGGLIAAMITPFAILGHWLSNRHMQSARAMAGTLLTLIGVAAAVAIYAAVSTGRIADAATLAFQPTDLFRYGSRWWSYLVPPIANPWLGSTASQIWNDAAVHEGLLEQQIGVGLGVTALAMIGARWDRTRPHVSSRTPLLACVAVAAFVFSLAPLRGGVFSLLPAAWLYGVVPMFRSYARFGVVVQLALAILAGIGVDRLRHSGTGRARLACIGLVIVIAGEYMVRPSAMSRDVLPTTAHRWVVQQANPIRVLDCTPLTLESESVPWLTHERVSMLGGAIEDCDDPQLAERLAAAGFTHLLERHGVAPAPSRSGLRVAGQFDDGSVSTVIAKTPLIYVAATSGFHRREHDAEWTWHWMGGDSRWTIVNTATTTIFATLRVELSAFNRPRQLQLRVGGGPVHTVVVQTEHQGYDIGPIEIFPGYHEMLFHPAEAPTVASEAIDTRDQRRLSFAVGASHWTVSGHRP